MTPKFEIDNVRPFNPPFGKAVPRLIRLTAYSKMLVPSKEEKKERNEYAEQD